MPNSLHVLIVDDQPDVADSFAMLVDQLGHDVQTAHSGRDALEILDDWRADIAFVDLSMPEMDGFEVADQIRQREAAPPDLIALTGYNRDEDREKAREHGFTRHLVKPPEPDELIALLDEAKSDLSHGARR